MSFYEPSQGFALPPVKELVKAIYAKLDGPVTLRLLDTEGFVVTQLACSGPIPPPHVDLESPEFPWRLLPSPSKASTVTLSRRRFRRVAPYFYGIIVEYREQEPEDEDDGA